MTKLIRLRVEVPADDDAKVEAVQGALRALMRGQGNQNIDSGAPELLAGPVIFWGAADVKRGPEERPNARGARKARRGGIDDEMPH